MLPGNQSGAESGTSGGYIQAFRYASAHGGLFSGVINNYKEWSWNLIDGLKQIGFELSSPQYSSLYRGNEDRQPHSLQALGMVAGQLRGPLACRPGGQVCFALISAQVVFIKCEAMIAMMAALILVSFGGSSFLKDYAVNALRYVLAWPSSCSLCNWC